jgi:peptide/nickel transport system substrate-binding protein
VVTQIIGTVKPSGQRRLPQGVMYAMSPASYQNAYGGKFAGGDIATTVLRRRSRVQEADIYGLKAQPERAGGQGQGRAEEVRPARRLRDHIGYRSSQGQGEGVAEAFQQSLGKVGIKVNVKPMADDTYTSETCGKPSYVVQNKVGLCVYGWGADWTTGYGFLAQIVDSRLINPEGGSRELSRTIPRSTSWSTRWRGAGRDEASEISAPDRPAGDGGGVIYPGIYAKGAAARKNVTNVFINDAFRSLRLHRHGREAVTHAQVPTHTEGR